MGVLVEDPMTKFCLISQGFQKIKKCVGSASPFGIDPSFFEKSWFTPG